MKFGKAGPALRKWSRSIHRDLSFFLSGVTVVYAVSGIAMNHRDTVNPNYTVEQRKYFVETFPDDGTQVQHTDIAQLLAPLGEGKHYTKHYFPQPDRLKIFLKGGSSLCVNLSTREAVYEKLTRRPLLSAFTRLHYNPGRWWTWFADLFAAGLILLALTGIAMVKGPKGLLGRGGAELAAGIAVPLSFLLL